MVFLRFLRPKIKEVMLSRDLLAAASLRTISTPSAAAKCSLYWLFEWCLSLMSLFLSRLFAFLLGASLLLKKADGLDEVCSMILSHTQSIVCLLLSLSKIPSHPIMIKSKLSWILNVFISGSQIMTLGFPPYFYLFASMSPKVLDTDSLPGNTLNGPYTYKSFSSGLVAALAKVCVLYIFPPAA